MVELISAEEDLPASPVDSGEADGERVLDELKGFFKESDAAEFRLSDEAEMDDAEMDDAGDEDESEEDDESDEEEADQESDDKAKVPERKLNPAMFAMLPSIHGIAINAPVSPGILPQNHAAGTWGSKPQEYHAPGFERLANPPAIVRWQAPWIGYRPLYFEDVWLERHGYDHGHLQPLLSSVKFFGTAAFLPYLHGATPHKECTYSLGLGRPGDCTPHFFTLPKKSERGFLYQSAVVAGTALLIP